jgi:adenylate cyclase
VFGSRIFASLSTSSVSLDERLHGTRRGRIVEAWLTNAAHYPLTNAVLEILIARETDYRIGFELGIMLFASVIQAYLQGGWAFANRRRPFLANMVGPAIFTLLAIPLTGHNVLGEANYVAYWVFAAAIGLAQTLGLHTRGRIKDAALLLESVIRASMLFAAYWIFEAYINPAYARPTVFFSDGSHVFIAIIVPMLGVLLGLANIARLRAHSLMLETASRLKKLTEWSWDPVLVRHAMEDRGGLSLKRRTRTIVFMDLRGFTPWSETHVASDVAHMLVRYYETAESVWSRYEYITVKLIADSVLIVFPEPEEAVRAALELRDRVTEALASCNLKPGIGINTGQLMEGVLGSSKRKSYEVIGDSVNVASRICQVADAGAILVSEAVARRLGMEFLLGPTVRIAVKGKHDTVPVHLVEGASSMVQPPETAQVAQDGAGSSGVSMRS